jgi:hypothetical protein
MVQRAAQSLAGWQRVEMLTDGLETHAVPMHTAAIGVRRGGRVVEGAPLLREYTSKAYRGFESLPLRHKAESERWRPFLINDGISLLRGI